MKLLLLFAAYALVLTLLLARAGFRRIKRGNSASAHLSRPGKKLLIIGATGGTGRHLVAQALQRGYTVTALVRNPAKWKSEHPQLQIIQGDVLDYSAVDAVMRGQQAVISALGHKRFFYPTTILSQGTASLIRAMEAHGVRRFVCQTSLGIGDSAGRMGLYYTFFVIPVILPFYFWDKARQERLIAASPLEWVIVRPAVLTNGKQRGSYRHSRKIGNFLWTARISRADVAEFMLNQLEENSYLRAAPGVAG